MKKTLFIGLFCIILFASCKKEIEVIPSERKTVLNTLCTITLYENGTKEIYDELFKRLEEIEKTMSRTIATSQIAQANNLSAIEKVELSHDAHAVLSKALEYAYLTDGAFNPAIGPLVEIWSIGTDSARIPTLSEIQSTIPLTYWKNIELIEIEGTHFVYLKEKGMQLDLGGIAKGYAADEMIRILQDHNIDRAIIDLGGNIYAFGEKENTDPWRIGIKNPFNSTGDPAIRLDVKNNSVVTSGVYERFFEKDGVRYHHLLDSKTGYPVNNGLMSVTIVTESSMLADVLSTAVFILGQEKGMDFLHSIGEKGFCINDKREVISTENLRDSIVVLDDSFTLLK